LLLIYFCSSLAETPGASLTGAARALAVFALEFYSSSASSAFSAEVFRYFFFALAFTDTSLEITW
jgi:hypothetical protein